MSYFQGQSLLLSSKAETEYSRGYHTSCTDTFVSYIFFCFQTLHITNSNPLFAFDIERNIMLSFLYDYYLLHTDFTLTIDLQSK